ncbi:hypothetical protein [Halosimplex pelagicum]|uniref:Uncharacterized protein n=1 Tax=Halosimplex pelagicum TaxID=869886 RepID=A0A7D5TXQ9_9EURY|nr:hypothetical protein [Halosimplex pelagicum]QLH85034.1 hypothetical protein HZS54_17685 [Halosimplex pelagicum]
MNVGLGTIAALLSVLVAIEIAQLGVLGSTWVRSRHNEHRLDALLNSLGIDPEDAPSYEVEAVPDGGIQDD